MWKIDSHDEIIEFPNWTVRYRGINNSGDAAVFIMLHGWTGDENSMWIFASRLPSQAVLIAPRGPYPTPIGGYGWVANLRSEWPSIEDFLPSVNGLRSLITAENFPQIELSQLHLLGFSQGAALAFSFALIYPELVKSIGSLSGFLPEDAEKWLSRNTFHDKQIFMAHGSLDDLVPVSRARYSAELLDKNGAEVDYCEAGVGHKLSASCFRSMEAFFHQFFN